MAEATLDLTRWPLVIATLPGVMTEGELLLFTASLDSLLDHGATFGLVLDGTGMKKVPTARMIMEYRRWLASRRARAEQVCVAYVVVVNSWIGRGVLEAAGHLLRRPALYHATSSLDEGIAWAERRLSDATPSEPPSSLAGEPRARADLPDLAPLLDLFDEAAYLVNEAGEVVFANTVALGEHGQNPDWLPQALSQEADADSRPCRIARVGWERDLYIVIPAAASLVDLPPRLRQVAERLVDGLTDKEIAAALDIPLTTVRTYVARIFRRLNVHNRSELVRLFGASVTI